MEPPKLTFHFEHQTFEHTVTDSFVFHPDWIEKIIENKRKIRQQFSSLAARSSGAAEGAVVMRNLQLHTTLSTVNTFLTPDNVSHIFALHEGVCAICDPEHSTAPAALAAQRRITVFDMCNGGTRSSALRSTRLALDLGQPQPRAQIFARLTSPGKLVVVTTVGPGIRLHLYNTTAMRKQRTWRLQTGAPAGSTITIRSASEALYPLGREGRRGMRQ